MTQTPITETPPLPGSDVLTNSSEDTFRTCPRKFYWSYQLGWRPARQKKPFRFGCAGHLGVDLLAAKTPMPDVMGCLDVVYDQHILDAADWPDPKQAEYDLDIERTTVQCLIESYEKAWRESRIEILESEKPFDLSIINPETGRTSRTFRQAGKRDRIGRLPDGRIALIETKFVAQDITSGSDYRQVLALNQQVSKYILAAQAEGHAIETCLWDAVRKPTIKPTPVPERDDQGLKIVRWPDEERAYTKQHKPRQTADKAQGQYLVTNPMTPKQWRHKLMGDIWKHPDRGPEHYFQRWEVPRLESDLREYQFELWWMAEAIRHCRNTGHWFRNSSACRNYNTLCPYYPLCSGEVDISQGVPAGFRQAENAHEELQPVEATP